MVTCVRCKKRPAVIFVTKIENGEKKTEGLCLGCAKELGVPVDNMLGDVMKQFGIDQNQANELSEEFNRMVESGELPNVQGDGEDGGAPTIDFPKIFGEGNVPAKSEKGNETSGRKEDKPRRQEGKRYKFLDTYCHDLTRRAEEGKIDRIVGREKETDRVIQILCRRQKNNPCLIGEPGVGKTAIAEGLAQKIADGNVPYKLKGKRIYSVDLTAMVAGTQFRGQFESRILGLLSDVREAGNVILVIDEVHNIVGSGEAEGAVNAANILKPALSRGEVRIIGATTLNEYRKYIEKDTALERRFQPVTVGEPSLDETLAMLGGIKHYYEKFHCIRIPDEVLRTAVVLSERYITDRYLPDKAIDLLDEAAAHVSLTSPALNESMEIRETLLQLKDERESLEATDPEKESERNEKYEKITKIRQKELELSQKLEALTADCEKVELTAEEIAGVIEVWTGIPAKTISQNEYERLGGLYDRLLTHIVGQDEAVAAVTRAIKRNRAGVSYKRKPVSFIFAGPTGVGKTELVKQLAADLFHTPETLIRLDMSEFMEKHSVSRIIGAPPGYVGFDEAGQLTEKIRRRPYSVILFDEIEKAHPDVLNILLQVLDDGRITDARGKTVNFENTVIVMTTNAGSDRVTGKIGFGGNDGVIDNDKTLKALSTFLKPEFINRVDEIITFRALGEEHFRSIARILLGELSSALAEKGMTFRYSDEAVEKIAHESFSPVYGARNIRRFITKKVEDPLAEAVISAGKTGLCAASLEVKNGEFSVSVL